MRWTEIPVHAIDFEGSLATGIVEYGVVTLHRGAIRAVSTRLCRPRGPVARAESAVHGLTAESLRAAPPFEADWLVFAGLRDTGVLAAHFSGTEHALLRSVWPFPRLSPDFLDPGRETADWGPWIDTGRVAAGHLSATDSAGLEDVVAALGLSDRLLEAAERWCPESRRRFHCAPFDALACGLVLGVLAVDAEGGAWTLARLLAASTADPRQREERRQTRFF